MSTIGKKIKETRQKMSLTQQELSDKTGITRAIISDIENDKKCGNWHTLRKIFEVLNIDVVAPQIVIEAGNNDKIIIHKKDLTTWYIKQGSNVIETQDIDLILELCK
jgi:transcriptional regulator with XRE-family HTH domain